MSCGSEDFLYICFIVPLMGDVPKQMNGGDRTFGGWWCNDTDAEQERDAYFRLTQQVVGRDNFTIASRIRDRTVRSTLETARACFPAEDVVAGAPLDFLDTISQEILCRGIPEDDPLCPIHRKRSVGSLGEHR
jgi:hypothetical protein